MFTVIPAVVLSLAVVTGNATFAPEIASTPQRPAPVPQLALSQSRLAADNTLRVDRGADPYAFVYVPLAKGDEGEAVSRLQRHLAAVDVYRGPIDGVFGREVESSVITVHKLLGLERSATWQASDWLATEGISHSAIVAKHTSERERVEVDLANQLLYIIRESRVEAVVHISTGNGATYWSKNGGPGGGYVQATTPQGDFTIYKHIPRWRYNYMGGLYKPWYFTPYYAVHGSRSVPSVPASHGCVRIPTWEADHLDSLLKIGLPIHIWAE